MKNNKLFIYDGGFVLLTTLSKKSFENIVGKGENAGNQHFLLFPPCFQSYPKKKKNQFK